MAEISDRAWGILFPAATVVFILVAIATVVMIVRYRDRGGEGLPPQIAEHRYATAVWLVITVALLGVVKVGTYAVAGEVVGYEAANDAMEVRVVAKQYWWEFEYLDREAQGVTTANELHIPVGQEVKLSMESLAAGVPDAGPREGNEGDVLDGVIHSFWVPKLSGKLDIVPGSVRELVIEAEEPGTYLGQCAEFCGLSHANMRFQVVAQDPGEFQEWLEHQQQPAEVGLEGLEGAGEGIFGQACVECHAIRGLETEDGLEANVRVGPDLTHFNSRSTFAGGMFEVGDDEALAEWLSDPSAVKPGAQMPDLDLSSRDINALIAFLRTLD
jgi:cytochrome c oxidase subunit II